MVSFGNTYFGPVAALTSAALFGASTPLAKVLLGDGVDPWLLAGLLYLGAGLGLGTFRLITRATGEPSHEAPLGRADLPWLGLVALSGGVIAPLLLMVGLVHIPASFASLLLNVEGLATMGIAWIVFKENVDARLLLGAFAILTGALLLSWQGGLTGLGTGALAILGACLVWGVDNNLTRKISSVDPVQLAAIKGLVAGAVNLSLAISAGAKLPLPPVVAASAAVGLLGYGVSLVLFVLALRHLGSARTGAYFSTAPFIGAVLSITVLGDPVTMEIGAAGVLMGLGVYLHLSERHDHDHAHDSVHHEHRHVHDEHHRHDHGERDPIGEPHSHEHWHAPLIHRHPHFPDLHHRHKHS